MVKQKKKKFKMWNKLLAFLGMFVMLTCCLAGTVQAGSYEAGKKGSLNLTVQQTDEDGKTTPLTGVKLELYRVADVSFDGNVHFVLTSSMSSAGYDFDSFKNASEWYSAAEKLAEVAAASSVKPVEAALNSSFCKHRGRLDLRCTGLSKGREEQHCRYYS